MNVIEEYMKAHCFSENSFFDNKNGHLFAKFTALCYNKHVDYCVQWSYKIFKTYEIHNEYHKRTGSYLSYHDLIGYIKTERKGTKRYSTVLEFYRDDFVVQWKLQPSKALRKILGTKSFRVSHVVIDGKHIHLAFMRNGFDTQYVKFDYRELDVIIKEAK